MQLKFWNCNYPLALDWHEGTWISNNNVVSLFPVTVHGLIVCINFLLFMNYEMKVDDNEEKSVTKVMS